MKKSDKPYDIPVEDVVHALLKYLKVNIRLKPTTDGEGLSRTVEVYPREKDELKMNYQDLQARINTWASCYRGYRWGKEDDEAIAQIRDILHETRTKWKDDSGLLSQSLFPGESY